MLKPLDTGNNLAISHALPVLDCLSPKCGACCMHMGYPPFVPMFDQPGHRHKSDPDWLELRRTHPTLAAECLQGARDCRGDQELPCLWLDSESGRCKHHKLRPAICRDFEPGEPACLEHRKRRGIKE